MKSHRYLRKSINIFAVYETIIGTIFYLGNRDLFLTFKFISRTDMPLRNVGEEISYFVNFENRTDAFYIRALLENVNISPF